MPRKIAVVLFNLGGPDSLGAVRGFLYNLFSDKAIIRLPWIFRIILARIISSRRCSEASEIYKQIGGKSPLLENTVEQATALEAYLGKKNGSDEFKAFVCMRYWHPMSDEVVRQVKSYTPDEVILLPLYPQYSTTTTMSSYENWKQSARDQELNVKNKLICCYPADANFIASHVKMISEAYSQALEHGIPRILFSAHGLPKKIVDAGDPYQFQVEKTVESIIEKMDNREIDYSICYQSRVGPLEWIKPDTESEILRACEDKKPIVMAPIAFVSEHSETLVELDIQYKQLAEDNNAPGYIRVPALGTNGEFIKSLASLCELDDKEQEVCSYAGHRICPQEFSGCPNSIR